MKNRIAFISEHASPLALIGGTDSGGQNIYVDRVARHLCSIGYEVDVFTRCDNQTIGMIVDYAPGIRVINIEAGPKAFVPKEDLFQYMDDFSSEMMEFIQNEEIEYGLIHAHFWMSGYVASAIKKTLDIPYVITFHALGKVRRIHQGTSDGFPLIREKIEEMIVEEADCIIAECPQDKEDLLVHYFAEEEKIRVIPCGFDKTEFYPTDKRKAKIKLGLKPSEFIILQLGRMVPRKGVDNVIRGIGALLREREIPVRLLVVGGDSDIPDPVKTPEIGRLQQIAKEENVLDKVTFIGRKGRDELKNYYNAADIFVSTPWYEPFGITPLEAMACGTPVIGSNVGGIKYSVEHGKTGFLVPANEPEILKERIFQIIQNKTLFNAFRINAIKRVNSMFTWEIVAEDIAALYQDVVRDKEIILNKNQVPFSKWLDAVKFRRASVA